MLKILTDLDSIKKDIALLNDLFDKKNSVFFNSPSYLLHAYKTFHVNDEIYFIIVYSGKIPTHYLPCVISRRKTLKFVSDKKTDYCGTIGNSSDFDAAKEIINHLIKEKKIQRIDLDNLSENDLLLNFFKVFVKTGAIISSYNNASFLSAGINSSFVNSLNSSEKSELKRIVKKTEQYPFKIITSDLPFPEKQFIGLRKKMIENGSRTINFLDEQFQNFIKKLFEEGLIELFGKSKEEDEFLSLSVVLKNKNTRMIWIDLYDSTPYINLSAYIEYIYFLESKGNYLLSFGRGAYDYKVRNFKPKVKNLYNLRYSKKKYDFLFTNYYPIRLFLKNLIK